MTTTADIDRRRPFCRPSWLSFVRQNPYLNLNERAMKAIHIWNLEEIWLKNDWVRVTTTADVDRWRPFCRPSWLSAVGQNPFSNLNERLVKAIHIWNLEDIRLKMTELEWPRIDGQTDGRTDRRTDIRVYKWPLMWLITGIFDTLLAKSSWVSSHIRSCLKLHKSTKKKTLNLDIKLSAYVWTSDTVDPHNMAW